MKVDWNVNDGWLENVTQSNNISIFRNKEQFKSFEKWERDLYWVISITSIPPFYLCYFHNKEPPLPYIYVISITSNSSPFYLCYFHNKQPPPLLFIWRLRKLLQMLNLISKLNCWVSSRASNCAELLPIGITLRGTVRNCIDSELHCAELCGIARKCSRIAWKLQGPQLRKNKIPLNCVGIPSIKSI